MGITTTIETVLWDGPGSQRPRKMAPGLQGPPTTQEEGVKESVRVKARPRRGCGGPGLLLARSQPSVDGRYRGEFGEHLVISTTHDWFAQRSIDPVQLTFSENPWSLTSQFPYESSNHQPIANLDVYDGTRRVRAV